MELDFLKELIEHLKNTDITELSIETEGTKVKLKRERLMSPFDVTTNITSPQPQAAVPQIAPDDADDDTKSLLTITAPLVGTFYMASTPEATPFVEVGDKVKKGQVICIIEAMKLMNEIECETDGTIVRILVENTHPVEYGEPLFLIEPVKA